jgi:hypothetical protein
LLLKEYVGSRAVRRTAHRYAVMIGVTMLGCLALLAGSTQIGQAQNSDSNGKLPPPPTIDANVNRNLTLADVRYDNKYDVYGGFGSYHANAGPQLLGGANLGGFDVQGTRWFSQRLGVTANVRGDYGTIGVSPNLDAVGVGRRFLPGQDGQTRHAGPAWSIRCGLRRLQPCAGQSAGAGQRTGSASGRRTLQ